MARETLTEPQITIRLVHSPTNSKLNSNPLKSGAMSHLTASHLEGMSLSAARIGNEMKCMSDLAFRILGQTNSLLDDSTGSAPNEMSDMAGLVESMARGALGCVVEKDFTAAKSVLQSYSAVKTLREVIDRELVASMIWDAEHVTRYANLTSIVCDLASLADRAANIAQEVLLAESSLILD